MTTDSEFGVGAQVWVRSTASGDSASGDSSPWDGEPTGIIVRSGGSAINAVWGSAAVGGRIWVIAFDEPATTVDGDGPFESAQVNERFLELAPPYQE